MICIYSDRTKEIEQVMDRLGEKSVTDMMAADVVIAEGQLYILGLVVC